MDIQSIIRQAGGPAVIGRACGISHAAVCQWRSVPVAHAAAIEYLTEGAIKVEALHPDVIWNRDEKGVVVSYIVPVNFTKPPFTALTRWIHSHPVSDRCRVVDGLAEMCGVTHAAVRHWANGTRPLPYDKAPLIEVATGGAVRVEALCSDLVWNRDGQGRVTGYTVPVSVPEAA